MRPLRLLLSWLLLLLLLLLLSHDLPCWHSEAIWTRASASGEFNKQWLTDHCSACAPPEPIVSQFDALREERVHRFVGR
jgi:hypothetical protein